MTEQLCESSPLQQESLLLTPQLEAAWPTVVVDGSIIGDGTAMMAVKKVAATRKNCILNELVGFVGFLGEKSVVVVIEASDC